MSWISKLCQTYDYAIEQGAALDESNPLPTIGFKLEKVQAIITLTSDGDFFDVESVSRDLPVPATPDSVMTRGNPVQPHPIFDNVKELCTEKQLSILAEWCGREDVPEDVKTIYKYLSKKSLKSDLERAFEKKQIKADLNAAFVVCFKVTQMLNFDFDFINSWSRQFNELMLKCKLGLCYASGKNARIAEKHPFASKNTMLISMTLKQNCLGRFAGSADNAVSIGIESTLKAHSMRKWLLNRQSGGRIFGMELVVWDTYAIDTVYPISDDDDVYGGMAININTGEVEAQKITRAAAGDSSSEVKSKLFEISSCEFDECSTIVIMAIDSATGKGRASIVYYQEFEPKAYLDHLLNWYNHCVWSFYSVNDDKVFFFTPTPRSICELIYGKDNQESIKKLKKQLYKQLIPCIVSEKPLPQNLISVGFGKVVNPFSYKGKNGKWSRSDWHRAVGTFCALLHKKSAEKGLVEQMALDEKETNRDYLYGRLLALADIIEQMAMTDNDSQRETNAIRYMQRFSQRPAETWKMLRTEKLIPYLNRLKPGSKVFYLRTIQEIEAMMSAEDFAEAKPLGPRFLQGYSCQRMYRKPKQTDGTDTGNKE